MKAIYSKPMLEVMTFSLNGAPASCMEKIHNNHHHGSCEESELGLLLESYGMTFTGDNDSCANGDIFEQYCYFTSQNAGGITLFNS